ncbi:hypothetical protein [Clostridium manihotivorum]|jgi:hypothetical protein|uniref:hypothetical protein n=2 Tax=Clostridium TaxID=1485 RepID=UPI0013E28FAA|nr:hypothetical protein [Clostridium manihotivorum]
MDDNKHRQKDRPKSNAELRKMFPKEGAYIGEKNKGKGDFQDRHKDHSGQY